ncbi:hypothetical protein Rsub_12278 [Raphidocelis subcapitata]|uniref:BFN domain-containing protein n=1 Tax=Raphidocelis subcapitata TaxID=307507 RepID=A0A2V0PNJ5_9CHLO|nr:hypothetical protein Rsub_12278 [Raphidocelis subcapitata]|eukprot:GBF99500.1 hypothetical protein Rsub_12278 [Raphidocelis subcapitata]
MLARVPTAARGPAPLVVRPLPPTVCRAPRIRTFRVSRASPDGERFLEGYVEVSVDTVRTSAAAAVVYLRLHDGSGFLPVHIGLAESNALIKEMGKQRQARPLTHDLTKAMLEAVGWRVTKVRITSIVANTYIARIHLARAPRAPASDAAAAASEPAEVDLDARPSDAINLAARFGAPIYVAADIAATAAVPPLELVEAAAADAAAAAGGHPGGGAGHGPRGESNAEIVRSCRDAIASFDDPTVMIQLQKELAIKEERFEDARTFHTSIVHEMTTNRVLRMVVAMESALADGRYEEAARLRDEYKRALLEDALHPQRQGGGQGGGGGGGGQGGGGGGGGGEPVR